MGFTLSSFLVAAGGRFVSAYVASNFNTNAGLWGAFAAGLFWGIGSTFQQMASHAGAAAAGGFIGRAVCRKSGGEWTRGAGVLSRLRGGNFGNGLWAAGATAALSPQIEQLQGAPARIIASALVGGTVSAATRKQVQ